MINQLDPEQTVHDFDNDKHSLNLDGKLITQMNQPNDQFDDPLLKLKPIVHIYRLPDNLFNCGLPASCIEEIYSTLESRTGLHSMRKRKRSHLEEEEFHSKEWFESCKKLAQCSWENQIEPSMVDYDDEDGSNDSTTSYQDPMSGLDVQMTESQEILTNINEGINTRPLVDFIFLSSEDESTNQSDSLPSKSLNTSDNSCPVLPTIDSPLYHHQQSSSPKMFTPIYPLPEYKLTLLPWLKSDGNQTTESRLAIDGTTDWKLEIQPVQSLTPMSPSSDHKYDPSPFWIIPENSPFDDTLSTNPSSDYSSSLINESDDGGEIDQMDFGQADKPIPFNWLDVSKIKIQSALVVEVIDKNGRFANGQKTKFIFKSIYDKFGKYHYEVNYIRTERDYIKLYFDDPQIRTKIKYELDEIMSNNRLNYELIVRGTELKNPCIHFVSDLLVDRRNQFEWIDLIKKLNFWPEDSQVTWKSTSQMHSGLYRVKIIVDSKIRTMIEETKGLISIDHRAVVEVIDDLNIIQCYRCFDYGHGKVSCKRFHRKCFFCGGRLHLGSCPVRNNPDQWYCGFCRIKGHSAVSKECPVLLEFIKPELEHFNHKYKFIFLDHDLGRRLCDDILSNHKRPVNQQMELKSLVASFVDSKMINPKDSKKIYQTLRDHLEKIKY